MASISQSFARTIAALTVAIAPALSPAIEEPKFTAVKKDGAMEIRQYEPSIVAEVVVTGPWNEASNNAFRLLADYIFGNNSPNQKIAMTAPVGMETETAGAKPAKGAKIAMTAPVGMEQEPAATNGQKGQNGPWRMSFTMPAEFTMDNLPKPNNPAVKIRQLPERKAAVITFSGAGRDSRFIAKEKELRDWMAKENLQPTGPANYSQYNPPWTPGFLRRNEVIIPVKN